MEIDWVLGLRFVKHTTLPADIIQPDSCRAEGQLLTAPGLLSLPHLQTTCCYVLHDVLKGGTFC